MSAHIHSWIDGHLAVRHRAYEVRGFVELSPSSARWPRTTGADVIMVAALLDPALRANGTLGILRRWGATLADLERGALTAPRAIYGENRAFWASFESAAIFLDDVAVMPPLPEVWDAVLAELSAPRNTGPASDGPIAHFDHIATYDDLFTAQLALLKTKRGFDTFDQPAGFSGGPRPIPRTTNSDVLQLATYWTTELTKVKQVFGHNGVVARWTPVLADVDKLAKLGKPDDVYAKNNELWRELQEVAIQIAVSDEAPSTWAMVVDSAKTSVTHLPENLGAAASTGADLLADAAHAVGKVVNEAGKGLLSGLGTPILIGAGLIGVVLLARRDHDKSAEG